MNSENSHTFLFADLAGFTALTEAHGDEEAAELAAEFGALVRELLPDHCAEQVKTIGDAVMIRAEKPDRAVLLGLRVIEDVKARPRFPVVHVGMDTGPATERGGDWFGTTINVAARVAGAAAGDEVLLTSSTREAAGEIEGVEFAARGQERFRNVSQAVQLFRASRVGDAGNEVAVDPVCRMAVTAEHCAGRLTHEGAEYCFCSLECVQAFAAAPDTYVRST